MEAVADNVIDINEGGESAVQPNQPVGEVIDNLHHDEEIQSDDAQSKETETKKSEPPWFQKRFDEMAGRNGKLDRENRQLAEALKATEDRLKKFEESKPEEVKLPPLPENFADNDEYLQAVVAHEKAMKQEIRDSITAELVKNRVKETTEDYARSSRAKIESFEEGLLARQEEIVKKRPDFFEKVGYKALSAPDVLHEIVNSDVGEEIAYHLGSNTALADRLATADRETVIREITKIETAIRLKSGNITKAPPPPKTLEGSSAHAMPTEVESMTTEQYAAHRRKQVYGF